MFSLITAIVSIALFSIIAAVSINHIPVDALITFKAREKTQEGLRALASGSVRYIKSVTTTNGVTTLPAPGTDLTGIIQPTFAFIPAAPSGMSWSIRSSSYSGLPAVEICLQPVSVIDEATRRGVVSVQSQFPAAAVFVNSSCGAISNGSGAHLTYWVLAAHATGT